MSDALVELVRVVLADDHPLFREGARAVLSAAEGIEVVGEASTGEEVIALAGELQPDVVLMDIVMPGPNGIEATRQIVRTSPHIRVLMMTMVENDESVFAAMQAGAHGYLLKEAPAPELVRAVSAVANGEVIFGPGVAERMMNFFLQTQAGAPPDPFPGLTTREREVLELMAVGHNSPTIARRLSLSPKTVRNHVSNILNKLQVADRAGAIIRARDAGLGVGG